VDAHYPRRPAAQASAVGRAAGSSRRGAATSGSPDAAGVADWYPRCVAGSDGRTLSNLANGLLALREDRAWRGVFGRDEVFGAALQIRPFPGQSCAPTLPRPLEDDDITRVQEWLQLAGLPGINKTTTYQAVELVAREHSYHSVKNYLEQLEWDGTDRLDDWLADCLGAVKTEYTMSVGRMFLISMIARIYQPGCQVDHMLILEGPQRTRKSTACRILGGEWFSDDLPPNVASKDAALHLRGKWLIEIAELHSFGRSEVDALKAFITRRNDIYRPPYGRNEVHQPRQCVFIGTTNDQAYLTDPTGGRRYWPVVTGEIDVDLLRSWRDRLFAEARARYQRGEKWWPATEFETDHIIPEQADRFEGDVWEAPIADFLIKSGKRATTIFEVATEALKIETGKIGTADQRRIAKVFQCLGWRRAGRSKSQRTWVR
jgi:predicted P-loop ATPase